MDSAADSRGGTIASQPAGASRASGGHALWLPVGAAALGALDGAVFAARSALSEEWLAQGLSRTVVWTAARLTLSGVCLGAAAGVGLLLSLMAWRVVLRLGALLDLRKAGSGTALGFAVQGLPLARVFAVGAALAALVIPVKGGVQFDMPYPVVAVASFAALWLVVSGLAAAAITDASRGDNAATWFRLRWLTVVGLAYVVVFLHQWATAGSRSHDLVLALGGLLAASAVFLLLCRPARLVDEVVRTRLGRALGAFAERSLPIAVLAAAIALWGVGWGLRRHAAGDAAERGRNVIVIVVDTLRADRVTLSADAPRDLTPNLRELLAARGTVFTQAISQAPWTLPAIASLITGLYPEQHGAEHISSVLSPNTLTLAEILSESGYRTGAVVSGWYASSVAGMEQGYRDFDESQRAGATRISSQQITDRALNFLERHGSDPFFLFLHYFDPHSSYMDHPGIPFADRYDGWLRDEAPLEEQHLSISLKRHLIGPRERQFINDLYDEETAYTDEHIGRLLRFLDEADLWSSTLVILVADHGEEFLERGWIGHTISLYDELIRVPLIVAAPDTEQPAVVSGKVETRWIFTTVLDYVGLPLPEGVDGHSLLRPEAAEEGFVRSSSHPVLRAGDWGTSAGKYVWLSCIVGDQWKLIADHLDRRVMLFDRLADAGELRDEGEAQPEVAAQLEKALATWEAELGGAAAAPQQVHGDGDSLQELRSLGYL